MKDVGYRKSVRLATLTALASTTLACSTLGPKPELSLVASEVKATKAVNRILVLPTVGTYNDDPNADINKSVPAGAFKIYSDSLILPRGLGVSAVAVGAPESVRAIAGVNWEVAFVKWVLSTQKRVLAGKIPFELKSDGKSRRARQPPTKLRLPAVAETIPTATELKPLTSALKAKDASLKIVARAHAAGEPLPLLKATGRFAKSLVDVETLFQHLVRRFRVTYLVASYVHGSPDDFDEDKPIHLWVALLNAKTGQFRYVAHSAGRKSEVPTTYAGLIGLMALNLFDELAEADEDIPL